MSRKDEGVSPLLDGLVCDMIGACLDILASHGELTPMLCYCGADGAVESYTFSGDTPEGCLEEARQQVRGLGRDVIAYGIAYMGFVRDAADKESVDALLVEFGERGSRSAYSAYVPYRHAGDEGAFESGEPLAAGIEPLLFSE